MKSVLIRAKQYRQNASGAEQGALDYILEHPAEIPRLSVKRLSELSYSSPSTIVRLCRKLGFDGFKDVQNSVLYELAARAPVPSRDVQSLSEDGSDIIDSVTYRNIASLEDSRKLVDNEALSKAVDYICNADTVLLFGLGASLLVAQDAYLKFIRIDKRCSCCEDIHSQYVLARNARPTDAALIISYSGRTEEICRCADILVEQGTPIIAITRFEPSPISRLATCCLPVVATEELYRSGAMSSRISQLNMIDILYTACVNRDPAKNSQQMARNRIEKGS